MKRKIYAGLSLALIGMALIACKKEVTQDLKNSPDQHQRSVEPRIQASEMAFVGIGHNELMDDLFDAYILSGVSADGSKEFTRTFLIEAANSDPSTAPHVKEAGVQNINDFFDAPAPLDFDNFYSSSLASDWLSPQDKMYLDNLFSLVSIEGIAASDLSVEIGVLESTISADLSLTNDDLFVLFAATQIARHSYDYWENNRNKWEDAGHPAALMTGGDLAKGDIAGGVGAGVGAVVVNVVPGAGQVAYGGAILGGAVAGTAAVAVYAFFDWMGW